MKRLVVKFLEDRYTWDGKKEESNNGNSPKRDQVKMNLETLRQQLAKVSSEIAMLSEQIESISNANGIRAGRPYHFAE